MWSPCERVLAADDPAVLDHALHADNTRVDRGNPAIAVLSMLLPPRSALERSDFVLWSLKRTLDRSDCNLTSLTYFCQT
jgi:hypothetical protein